MMPNSESFWLNVATDRKKYQRTFYAIKFTVHIFILDNFVYINGSYKAQLQSPVLLWEPFHQVVGLCLRFTYLIPVKSKSTIKVLLREPRKEEPILAWQLSGYHGTKWWLSQWLRCLCPALLQFRSVNYDDEIHSIEFFIYF